MFSIIFLLVTTTTLVLGIYPGSSPLAPAFVMDVDNSSITVPTSQWYPALLPATTSYNLYGYVGLMPRINSDGSTVNGGLPQLGNLTLHLAKLRVDLARLLPPNPDGACLLDWEFWRAEWNYTLPVYQNASLVAAAASLPPGTLDSVILSTAIAAYEGGCRTFLEASLASVKAWYPGCLAGIYAYPQNDWSFGGYVGPQAAARRAINDRLEWLWRASSALFPSIYLTSPAVSKYDGQTTEEYVGSTVVETLRCAAMAVNGTAGGGGGGGANATTSSPPLVLPLMWYVYDAFPRPSVWQTLTEEDTRVVVSLPSNLGADGLLVWGAVGNPPFTPKALQEYLQSPLGPTINDTYTLAMQCAVSRCSGKGRCMPQGGCRGPPVSTTNATNTTTTTTINNKATSPPGNSSSSSTSGGATALSSGVAAGVAIGVLVGVFIGGVGVYACLARQASRWGKMLSAPASPAPSTVTTVNFMGWGVAGVEGDGAGQEQLQQ